MSWTETVRRCFESNSVLYSGHARREMRDEELGTVTDRELYEAVCSSEVLTEYPDDRPYPSVLLLGRTRTGRPLHTVCAYDADGDRVVVVTVYEPDPDLWEDLQRRRR